MAPVGTPPYTLAMPAPRSPGAFHLFRLFGVNVYLHWTWFVLVYLAVRFHGRYSSTVWDVLELVAVFGIILLHEFGHALACRSVGGKADRIVLWPLGGVAFVQPPSRPGAMLWSIAAGPLVNVLIAPLLYVPLRGADLGALLAGEGGDMSQFMAIVFVVNIVILCFNLLPIYPLDGGQIVQSILWFFLGRATSLRIVAIMGVVAAAVGVVVAASYREYWLVVVALFIGWQSFHGYRVARYLASRERHGDML